MAGVFQIPSDAPPGVAAALRRIRELLQPWLAGNANLNGRRIVNAGPAIDPLDYATLDDVKRLVKDSQTTTADTPASLNVRTDRGLLANIPGAATVKLGFLYTATDYDRVYRANGSAWEDAPGQPTRGAIAYFDSALAPTTGWQLCDGSTVTRSASDATTASYTVPNLTGANRFLRSVSGTSGGTGGSATTHTHQVDPPNTTSTTESAGHTHAVDPPSTTSGDDSGAGQVVQSGTGVTVAAHTHTHDTDIASFASGTASNTHTHDTNIAAFTSAAPSGTGGSDALPPYYEARPYVRL